MIKWKKVAFWNTKKWRNVVSSHFWFVRISILNGCCEKDDRRYFVSNQRSIVFSRQKISCVLSMLWSDYHSDWKSLVVRRQCDIVPIMYNSTAANCCSLLRVVGSLWEGQDSGLSWHGLIRGGWLRHQKRRAGTQVFHDWRGLSLQSFNWKVLYTRRVNTCLNSYPSAILCCRYTCSKLIIRSCIHTCKYVFITYIGTLPRHASYLHAIHTYRVRHS